MAQIRTAPLPFDLYETDTAFLLRAQLPGVRKEDLDLRLDGDRLVLGAVRHEPVPTAASAADSAEDTVPVPLFRELGAQRWERSIQLRVPVEADAVEARLEAGILQLSLPKAPQARPRSIPVKVA